VLLVAVTARAWLAARELARGQSVFCENGMPLVEGVPPDAAELAVIESLRLADPGALDPVRLAGQGRSETRATELLYRAWRVSDGARRRALGEVLAGRDHALALLPVAEAIHAAGDATNRPRAAGEQLEALLSSDSVRAVPPAALPDRDLVLLILCEVVQEAAYARRSEDATVLRAAIRGIGWLADPATSGRCVQAVRVAASEVATDASTGLGDTDALVDRALGHIRL
jgi:hypothetical protein